MIKISEPLTRDKIIKLKVGQEVLFTGTIYTARDQAHKKLVSILNKKEAVPFELKNSIIYYAGPTPARPGMVIGSCGPTTSSRMDKYSSVLMEAGVVAMIGKGRRSDKVKKDIKKYNSIYFLAPAGCGALIHEKIKSSKVVAFDELGPEAIYELYLKELPLIVGVDSRGADIYNGAER